jgi:hypothetical protein
MEESRGERNCNPLNLRPSGDPWIGLRTEQTDPGYLQFQTSFHGIRAGAKNLLTYFRVYKRQTPSDIIGRWAPKSDNNPTSSYISTVAKALGVGPADKVDLENQDIMFKMIEAMIGVECGRQPYPKTELMAAIQAAYDSHTTAPEVSTIVVPPAPTGPTPQIPPKVFPASPPQGPQTPINPPLVDQPTSTPTRKVLVGGTAGAVAFIIMVFWNKYFPGAPIPAEYATEIAGLVILAVTLVTQYFVRNRATDIPPGSDPSEEIREDDREKAEPLSPGKVESTRSQKTVS